MDIKGLKKEMLACFSERENIQNQQELKTIFENLVKIAETHVHEAYNAGHVKGLAEALSIPEELKHAHDDGYDKGLAKAQLLADNALVVERSRQSFTTESPAQDSNQGILQVSGELPELV